MALVKLSAIEGDEHTGQLKAQTFRLLDLPNELIAKICRYCVELPDGWSHWFGWDGKSRQPTFEWFALAISIA